MEEDRRLTCEELSAKVGVSSYTVDDILRNKLHKRKFAAKWVPHILTEEQKGNRVRHSASNLRRFRREGNDFIHRISAGDETTRQKMYQRIAGGLLEVSVAIRWSGCPPRC